MFVPSISNVTLLAHPVPLLGRLWYTYFIHETFYVKVRLSLRIAINWVELTLVDLTINRKMNTLLWIFRSLLFFYVIVSLTLCYTIPISVTFHRKCFRPCSYLILWLALSSIATKWARPKLKNTKMNLFFYLTRNTKPGYLAVKRPDSKTKMTICCYFFIWLPPTLENGLETGLRTMESSNCGLINVFP